MRRLIACAFVAFAAIALTAPEAHAAERPGQMPWATLDRFGGDADGNGRLDSAPPRLAAFDVVPVLVRPAAAICAAADKASWRLDGQEVAPVAVEAEPSCRAVVPVPEGRHTIVVEAGERRQFARIDVEDRLIVALGDSVASGEGNPEGPQRWLDGPCHRSAVAGFEQAARLLGQSLAKANDGRSITFVSLACSGAEIRAGLLGPYAGVDPDGGPPYSPQVERLRRIARQRPAVDAVLLSVGANDVQFSAIVKECGASPGDCRSGRAKQLLRDFRRLRRDYDLLGPRLRRAAPGAPILITEYFDPTHGEEGEFCAASVGFTSRAEARWAYEALLRPLNSEIEAAAVRNRWRLVTGIASDFERHGYCAGAADRWIRRLLASAIFQGDVLGTLHPSRPGHAAIAQRVVVPLADALGLTPPPPRPETDEKSLLEKVATWLLLGLGVLAVLALLVFVCLMAGRLWRFFFKSTESDPVAETDAAQREGETHSRELPEVPGDTMLQKLGVGAATVIAQLGSAVIFATIVGGGILWLRFWSAELPADQAVDSVSQGELVTTGTQALSLFFLLGLVAVAIAWFAEEKGQWVRSTRRALVVIGLAELVVATFMLSELEFVDNLRLLAGLFLAAILIHFLVDRALGLRSAVFGGDVAASARGWVRTGWSWIWKDFWKRLPARIWDAVPLVLLAGALTVALVADGPTRYAIVPLLLLAAAFFVGPGGIAEGGTAKEPRGKGRGLEAARVAFSAASLACIVILIVRDEPWLGVTSMVAVVLGLLCLTVAAASKERFLPYAIAVLVSVPLLGASASLLRGVESPQLQPVAALLKTGNAACGVYIGESDGKLWMGHLVLDERANVKHPRRGSIVSIESERIAAVSIGALEPVALAQRRAAEMRNEMLDANGNKDPSQRTSTCAPQKPPIEVRDSWQRQLAERFQPELVIDREDRFWPIPVRTLFSMQDRRAAVCRRVAEGGRGCLRLGTPGQFPWAGGEGEWIEYPAADTSSGDQHDLMIDALDSADPARSANVYFLVSGEREGDKPITIQYWFFYPFNYQPIVGGVLDGGYHEGDFESIAVLLSGKTERPRYLWMARHDKEGRIIPWNDDYLSLVGDHPTVFVARGSHASYETCGRQVRYVAKYGLVDDRPTCNPDRQLHLASEATPLTDLSRVAWGCWRGLFGHKNEERSYEQIPYLVSDAPRSPLWQQRFGEVVSEPCRGIEDPGRREGMGEEVVEEGQGVPAQLRRGAGRLDPAVDQCADWESPPATGTYVVACDQGSLSTYLSSGLEDPGTAGVRIDLARAAKPRVGEFALPAIARNREGTYLDDLRIVAASRTVVTIFASCPRGAAIVGARFANVVVEPGRPLRLRNSPVERQWTLSEPDGTVVAEATPFPTEVSGGRLVPAPPKSDRPLACGGA